MTLKPLVTTYLLLICATTSAQTFRADYIHFFSINSDNIGSEDNIIYSAVNHKPLLLAVESSYISKTQAIEIVKHHTSGNILSVKLIRREMYAFYKITILTAQGSVKTLCINALENNQ